MPITIRINNLSLCHKGSNGISTATIPDVCNTPSPTGPIPIPYPNIAMSSDLVQGTTTITADGGNMCANYGSEFSKSTGDEAGNLGGVASGTFIMEATWITFSFDVKLEGKGACRLTDKMFHNHQNTVNMAGELQALPPPGNWNLQCILDILCKQDKDVVAKLANLRVDAVDPLIYDDPIYKNGKWTTKPFPAGGTQQRGVIQITRDISCMAAACTLYHEMIHAGQPRSMSWAEKEYDAYKRTEQWAIDRGLPPPIDPSFRTEGPITPPLLNGPTIVNDAAIKAFVDKNYPLTGPSSPGGVTPPQVVGRTPDGKSVILSDGTTRPPKNGDTYPAKNPRNPPNESQIPPGDFKCP